MVHDQVIVKYNDRSIYIYFDTYKQKIFNLT